jgi:hypothetical protein
VILTRVTEKKQSLHCCVEALVSEGFIILDTRGRAGCGSFARHCIGVRSSRVVDMDDHLQGFLDYEGAPTAFRYSTNDVLHACRYHLRAAIIDMPVG